jgi:hypothetical protein
VNSLSCCRFLHRVPRSPGKYRSIDARPLAATVVSTWWRASPPIPISRVIQRMSANVDDARLGRRLSWRLWLCRKLKHRCLLPFAQICQENTGAIRKLEGIVMYPRLVFVDLPKDRRPEVYRFRPPRGEAKGGGGAFHLLGKSKLCSSRSASSASERK